VVNFVVSFSNSTSTLPSKHQKRHNILPSNIQTPKNLLTDS